VSEFDKPIGRAWRRMRLQRFLSALVWCWGAALLVVAGTIAYEKIADKNLPGADWLPFAVAGGLGLLFAAGIALLTGPSRVDAAVEIDRLFGLNDRLATTLTLPADLRGTPAGRALLADTLSRVGGLDIGAKFGLSMPRRAWVPLVPALLAVGLMFAEGSKEALAALTGKKSEVIDAKVAKKQLQTIAKSMSEKQKQAEAQQLSMETQKILAEVTKAADKLAKSPPAEKDKAMVEMNKLQNALKERQKQVGTAEQIAKQLEQMKEMANNGPADEFAKDMAKGDFQKAAQEMKQLAEKLKAGKLTETEKKNLGQQLADMKKQMEKLANMEQRKKQLDDALKAGAISPEQHQKQMEKLAEQSKGLKKMADMAQQLQKAADAMAKGDMKKAADTLGMSQKQLEALAKEAQEFESLDAAMADLQDAKDGMGNDAMNQLGNKMDGMNGLGQGSRPGAGNGLGRGRGQGDRPEAEDKTNMYNAKTKAQIGKGKAVIDGTANAREQSKGISLAEVQGTVEASAAEQADAISSQKIPKAVKKHAIGYFDMIRKGQ
jgi:myosin heavy subunit